MGMPADMAGANCRLLCPQAIDGMEALDKQASSLVLRALSVDPAPDQLPSGRHRIEAHHQTFLGGFVHHGGEDYGIDLRHGVFYGKTHVSVSVRFNAADHPDLKIRQFQSSSPIILQNPGQYAEKDWDVGG